MRAMFFRTIQLLSIVVCLSFLFGCSEQQTQSTRSRTASKGAGKESL